MWNLRELLDPAGGHEIALPPDDQLTGDLTAPHWKMTSAGRVQVESKEEIRKRLGRSTDAGDAVAMAFWEEQKPKARLFDARIHSLSYESPEDDLQVLENERRGAHDPWYDPEADGR